MINFDIIWQIELETPLRKQLHYETTTISTQIDKSFGEFPTRSTDSISSAVSRRPVEQLQEIHEVFTVDEKESTLRATRNPTDLFNSSRVDNLKGRLVNFAVKNVGNRTEIGSKPFLFGQIATCSNCTVKNRESKVFGVETKRKNASKNMSALQVIKESRDKGFDASKDDGSSTTNADVYVEISGEYVTTSSAGEFDENFTSYFGNETFYANSSDSAVRIIQEFPWPVKKEAVVEGDIVLGGLMMVHEREDTITCGPVMPQGGIQALEAMLYTLDRLNESPTSLLPNVTLGAHILDDCDKDTYGLEMAVDFIKGKCTFSLQKTNSRKF